MPFPGAFQTSASLYPISLGLVLNSMNLGVNLACVQTIPEKMYSLRNATHFCVVRASAVIL